MVSCPICETNIRTNELERHATVHQSTIENLWLIKNGLSEPPKCACSCGGSVKWNGWKKGYNVFVVGHNANVETEEAKSTRLNALREAYSNGLSGWSKNLTKETDERVKARAAKTSQGRKRAFEEGRIRVWSENLSKNDDERLASISQKMKHKYANGELRAWHSGKDESSDVRIKLKNDNLRRRYADGELTIWSKGLTAANDERLRLWAETRREKCNSLGFEYPTRMSLEDVKSRLSQLKQIKPVDETFSNYRNWQLRNLLFKCIDCGTTSMESLQTAVTDRCVVCNPFSSLAQREIFSYVHDELGFTDSILNDRVLIKPYELDVVVPSKRFAIEYNGLYYHNARYRAADYHDKKTLLSKQNGYTLLHVFEDEWINKKDTVKSMIRHRLKMNQNLKGGARACQIRELEPTIRKKFFNLNHLEGDVGAIRACGLFDVDGRLVAAASLRFPMHKNKYDDHVELARFATLNNLNVAGALSRLTEWAKITTLNLERSKLLTYADGRIGQGTAYANCGWNYVGQTEPRFWWTDNFVRYNRFKVRADKEETEKSKANRLGLTKIYGCRNYIYEIDIKSTTA
jgi:very-short-patch-repair endonuclease